jgi:hypothetical protein
VVEASEAGGLMIVDANCFMVGCTWSVTPQLIHVAIRGFMATAVSSEDSLTVLAPIGHGVYWVMQGMAEAIRLSALLDGDFTTWSIGDCPNSHRRQIERDPHRIHRVS